MKPHNPYRLCPYHNPEGVDESKVPDGWRMLYADEAGRPQNKPCRRWYRFTQKFSDDEFFCGNALFWTYIVPVSA